MGSSRPPNLLLIAPLVLAAVGTAGCSQREPDRAAPPNVIVVLVDAMRADRLGPYGFDDRPTTPNLSRFAAESVVFEQTISQDGWTVPSVASLFTGVYPQTHQVLSFVDPRVHSAVTVGANGVFMMDALSGAHETLAERFKAAGYDTAAILKSDVVNAGRGFQQGFDHFDFLDIKPKDRLETGAHVTDATIEYLDGRPAEAGPFFMYLHYMDPHTSYIAPEPYYSKYSKPYDSNLTGDHFEVVAFNEPDADSPTDADVEKLKALYDSEIEYWDSQFQRLIEYLRSTKLLEETIVVVTADHGEAFWEHRMFEHRGVFQENIAVPMIFRVPGVNPGRIRGWVEMVDIGPTVAELAGVQPGQYWVGSSHARSILEGTPVERRDVSSEWANERALIDPDGLKILLGHGEARLYDLKADAGESVNLAAERPDDLRRLKARLDDKFQKAVELQGLFAPAGRDVLSDEQVEALKALGYL